MGEKIVNVITAITNILKNGPKSISEISKLAEINWRTAESYLEILKQIDIVGEMPQKTPRMFYYKDRDNYFKLPVKEDQADLITTIYSKIKKLCVKFYNKEPTKTQVYKILWNIDQKLTLGLPIGWYMYGPCCVQIYSGDEIEKIQLSKEIEMKLEKTTQEYCAYDNIELQKRVYNECNNPLYCAKEKLLAVSSNNKEELNLILMDLIKYSPPETIYLVTEFVKKVMKLGWSVTKTCFEYLWRYISIIEFKKSLEFYYDTNISLYLDSKINELRKDAELQIEN